MDLFYAAMCNRSLIWLWAWHEKVTSVSCCILNRKEKNKRALTIRSTMLKNRGIIIITFYFLFFFWFLFTIPPLTCCMNGAKTRSYRFGLGKLQPHCHMWPVKLFNSQLILTVIYDVVWFHPFFYCLNSFFSINCFLFVLLLLFFLHISLCIMSS